MKKSILSLLIICSFAALNSNAQISLGGLKGKVADKANKKEKASASSNESAAQTEEDKTTPMQYYNYFVSISGTASSLMDNRSGTKYYTLKDDTWVRKLFYDSLKTVYLKKEYKSSDVLRNIREIDTFYTIYPQKLKATVSDESVATMQKLSQNSKETRMQPDFFQLAGDGKIALYHPETMIDMINDYQKKLRKALLIIPGDADILKTMNKTDSLKVDCAEYLASGQYSKDFDTIKELKLDRIRCPKAVNNDAACIAAVKKSFSTMKEKLLRTSISSTEWKVNRNSFGTITDRTMLAYVVYTNAEGKCFIEQGQLYCNYVGGKWENPKFHFFGGDVTEMLIKNAQK
ncbi:hypothetical protein [Fluviicola taffensis]|uniref:Uncharacterized protein n=1 Tax=Fluviicola taffensis (strain DSM 16823 / NCIMB 13979 / RW262) TaxID=755732 RepID=F2IAZ1_FLUTR|nr:hypothetical protein [Fluviicola taffensis]AEA45315.1 hypothetical protein Fluta_3343 [Fluviicola taffensis DSM 16823]